MKAKVKFALNLLLMVVILGAMYYFIRSSMTDILAELRQTSLSIVTAVMALGTIYLFIEGRSVKEIAVGFQPEFTTKRRLIYRLLLWILSNYYFWCWDVDIRSQFLS